MASAKKESPTSAAAMWHKREAERPFSEKIEEERWKNGAVLNHHPFVKAGGLLQHRLSIDEARRHLF